MTAGGARLWSREARVGPIAPRTPGLIWVLDRTCSALTVETNRSGIRIGSGPVEELTLPRSASVECEVAALALPWAAEARPPHPGPAVMPRAPHVDAVDAVPRPKLADRQTEAPIGVAGDPLQASPASGCDVDMTAFVYELGEFRHRAHFPSSCPGESARHGQGAPGEAGAACQRGRASVSRPVENRATSAG